MSSFLGTGLSSLSGSNYYTPGQSYKDVSQFAPGNMLYTATQTHQRAYIYKCSHTRTGHLCSCSLQKLNFWVLGMQVGTLFSDFDCARCHFF